MNTLQSGEPMHFSQVEMQTRRSLLVQLQGEHSGVVTKQFAATSIRQQVEQALSPGSTLDNIQLNALLRKARLLNVG